MAHFSREQIFWGSADVHIGHRKSATAEPAGTSVNQHRKIADVDVVKNSSVTTTELSPLATIRPYSVLGRLSGLYFLTRSPAIAEGPRDAGVPVEIW